MQRHMSYMDVIAYAPQATGGVRPSPNLGKVLKVHMAGHPLSKIFLEIINNGLKRLYLLRKALISVASLPPLNPVVAIDELT